MIAAVYRRSLQLYNSTTTPTQVEPLTTQRHLDDNTSRSIRSRDCTLCLALDLEQAARQHLLAAQIYYVNIRDLKSAEVKPSPDQ